MPVSPAAVFQQQLDCIMADDREAFRASLLIRDGKIGAVRDYFNPLARSESI